MTIRSIGFVGLGNMGMPMVTRLLAAGYEVTGFDVAEEPRAALAGLGQHLCGARNIASAATAIA